MLDLAFYRTKVHEIPSTIEDSWLLRLSTSNLYERLVLEVQKLPIGRGSSSLVRFSRDYRIGGKVLGMDIEDNKSMINPYDATLIVHSPNEGEAWLISDKMVDQDVVSWTTMIDRLRLFAGILNACADQVVEAMGKQVHGYITQIRLDPLSFTASDIVHMDSKYGIIENATKDLNGFLNQI
ncbi:pentatricopeptide repeat-containing protein [Quercus suber]|uniref:Pentatricopeptide repeat-containing protein n=1 Tax=Quercus suber TaxID=58331 RepID=A0AAW0LHY7_QUESU